MVENARIDLLIVDRSLEDGARVEQALRSAGYEVVAFRAQQEEQIRHIIAYKSLDLVIVRLADGLPSPNQIRQYLSTAGLDIPIIAGLDNLDTQTPAAVLRAGADDFFLSADVEHLVIVVHRELANLKIRRQSQFQELQLKESEIRIQTLLENSNDAIAYVHEGSHVYANPTYLEQFSYSNLQEIEGVPLMNLVIPEDRDRLKRHLRNSIKVGKATDPIDLTVMDSQSNRFPVKLNCIPTRMNDEPCLQIIVQDPAKQRGLVKRLAEYSAHVSTHDTLTGLSNRKSFIDHLEKLGAGDTPITGAVLYILLTDYRSVSEQGGLSDADILVRDIGKLLEQLISKLDALARFADAVFTIYTPQTSRDIVMDMGRRISAIIKDYVANGTNQLISTESAIGVVLLGDDFTDTSYIMNCADRACEAARRHGQNQIQLFSTQISEPSSMRPKPEEEQLIAEIRTAVSEGRLQLLFQPIASFHSNTTERYKAYLRILDANQKPMAMDQLTKVAERRGLMRPLDKWALLKALETLSDRYHHGGKSITLFVRISQNTVLEDDFSNWLKKHLSDTELPGETLVIEVTEESAEQHFKPTLALREKLRQLGIGFALTHFGGRTNSERILTHLRPDYVKLDSNLIERLSKAKDEASREIVKLLAEKARRLNVLIVAADIATAPQMASIWQFGVTLVQGDMVQEASTHMDFDFQQFVG